MRATLLIVFTLFLGSLAQAQNSQSTFDKIRRGFTEESIQIELNGLNYDFQLVKNNAFSQELLQTNPNLKSFDLVNTEFGMKGKLTLDQDQVFIHLKNNKEIFTYHLEAGSADFKISKTSEKAECGTKESPKFFGQNHISSSAAAQKSAGNLNNGAVLKTYRLALIGTGEFTENNGGTETSAATVAVSTVNGINLIFESDASISLTLVNSQFYTNSASDPFTPNLAGGDSFINQAAEAMAMNFSDSSYDIGHVIHHVNFGSDWSAGGLAGLGTVCDNGTFFSVSGDSDGLTGPNKAAAWSGSFNNTNNSWIQLISHEIGHQFDALHSFNGGGNNNCNFGISSVSAYEIGSGTTLMSYSDLCPSSQNVPGNGSADNYFHSTSLDQIISFTNALPTSCAVESTTGNSIPQVSLAYSNSPVIPIGTPFELEGTATDADSDPLLYTWEQIDEDGPGTPTQAFIGSQAANSAIAPLFKCIPPSSSPIREFPELSNILAGNNENLSFEALPQVSRAITFAFIVRDDLGGLSSEELVVNSSASAGPFSVSSDNTESTWVAGGGNMTTITWDVADTDNGTINCQNVDIYFSTDNGATFPFLLAEGTPNDGTHDISIPNLPTETGRIKIKATDNIFFDINDALITIDSSCQANGSTFIPDIDVEAPEGDAALDLDLSPEFGNVITAFSGTLDTSDNPTTLVTENNSSCLNFTGNDTYSEAFPFQVDVSGLYTFTRDPGPFGLVLHVYANEYNASSPCLNWIAGSFDSGTGTINSSLTLDLTANLNYVFVMSGFASGTPSLPADFVIGNSGPGDVLDGAAAPDGFIYQYVISDSDGTIVDIVLDANLTSYAAGTFTVSGLSSDESSDFSVYVGQPLSSLENDILDLTICGGFSANSVEVVITPNETCVGDLTGDGAITISDLSPFLSQFGCTENCTADINGDGIVTIADLSPFLASFGTVCD